MPTNMRNILPIFKINYLPIGIQSMALLKKLALASVISAAMLVNAPSAIAGKVANQTQAEVVQSLDDTVTAAEAALVGIQNRSDKETVMALLKKAKQTAKTIESSVVLSDRDRAMARVNKARSAFRKGQFEKSEALMTEAVQRFKDLRTKFHNF